MTVNTVRLVCFKQVDMKKKDILKVLWSNTSSLVCRLTHFHLEMRV